MKALRGLNPWYALYCYVLVSCALFIRASSDGLYEQGDSVLHYLIVQGANVNPACFLDHWGKPLFTLLAYPFHGFGLFGLALFNGLCIWICCIAAWYVLPNANKALWLFPILVLASPEYFTTAMSGLTEILFATLALLTLALERHSKGSLAAIVCGAAVMSRPEAIGLVPVFAAYLAIKKRWKHLLLIPLIPIIYSLIGAAYYGDLFWVLNRDPYGDSSAIYGSGEWTHFLSNAPRILGTVLTFCATGGAVFLIVSFVKGTRAKSEYMLLIALIASVAIWGIHSYVWVTGTKGSLGLLRVLTTTVPMLALLSMPLLQGIAERSRVVSRIGLLVLAGLSISHLHSEVALPMYMTPQEELAELVVEEIADMGIKQRRVVALAPMIPLKLDLNAYDEEEYISVYDVDIFTLEDKLNHGDLFVWDAQLCPNEGGVPISSMLNRSDLVEHGSVYPKKAFTVLNGERMHYRIFEYRTPELANTEDLKQACKIRNSGTFYMHGQAQYQNDTIRFKQQEFLFGTHGLQWHESWPNEVRLELSGEFLPVVESDTLHLVMEALDDEKSVDYIPRYFPKGQFAGIFKLKQPKANSSFKVYLWNPSGSEVSIVNLKATVH